MRKVLHKDIEIYSSYNMGEINVKAKKIFQKFSEMIKIFDLRGNYFLKFQTMKIGPWIGVV